MGWVDETMKHEEASRTQAVERYNLGDMTPDERDTFEQHYFECNDCWTAVRHAEMFAQNARALGSTRSQEKEDPNVRPFPPRPVKWIVPAAAAAALLMVFGLGPLREWIGSLPRQGEVPHLYVTGEMRGAEATNNALPAKQWVTLLVDILPVENAAGYRLELRGPGEARHLDVSTEKAKNTVSWLLRPLPSGSYELVIESVHGGKRSEVTRHRIQVGGGS
jgi:hypothetical protein